MQKFKTNPHGQIPNKPLVQFSHQLRETFQPRKRLLLIQSPQFLFENINLDIIRRRGYYAYPPTGLQWIAKALEDRGFEIEIFDLNFHLLDRIIQDHSFDYRDWLSLLDQKLTSFHPSLVGVTCLSVYTDLFVGYHPLTAILRHLTKKKQYITLAGGPTASNEIKGYLERGLTHYLLEGESEKTINYLMDVLFEEELSSPFSGIHYFFDHRCYETTGEAKTYYPEGNLINSYAKIPVERYNEVGCLNPYSRMSGRQNERYGAFLLNRGCRANCKFCSVRSFMGKGTRTHPVEEVLAEIRYLTIERGVRHFEVLDDDFLVNPGAVKELLIGLTQLRQKHPITWSANNGLIAASITQKLLDLMKTSGCVGFKIGFETGNKDFLKQVRKPGSVQGFLATGKILQDYPEFFVGGSYIIGLFGTESFGQMLDTFHLARRLYLDWASFSLFQYTSDANSKAENMPTNIKATEFIPTKDTSEREIPDDPSIPLGPEVFSLPKVQVPNRDQLRHIWMTFNLYCNYINNKHLKPSGNPDLLIPWLEALMNNYPTNPYMPLFAGIGHKMAGRQELAVPLVEQSQAIVERSANWTYRFEKFGLEQLLRSSAQPNSVLQNVLLKLEKRYSSAFQHS